MDEQQLPYLPFSRWLKKRYGASVRKISLNAGFGCPNKDGTISRTGCVFCDVNESGVAPATIAGRAVGRQLHDQIDALRARRPAGRKFMAYLQAGSNTHAPDEVLRDVYAQAVSHPDVVALAVSTRPDCLPESALDLIADAAAGLDVWIELGAQSAHERTLATIGRHHDFPAVVDAVGRAKARGFFVCLHLMVGLPGESVDDMVATARTVAALGLDGVKFHPLCITRGSALEALWRDGKVELLDEGQYVEAVVAMLAALPADVVVQRISGSGRPEVHLAPDWTRNINRTKNLIAEHFVQRK